MKHINQKVVFARTKIYSHYIILNVPSVCAQSLTYVDIYGGLQCLN